MKGNGFLIMRILATLPGWSERCDMIRDVKSQPGMIAGDAPTGRIVQLTANRLKAGEDHHTD